jgi:hypothetical protein
LLEPQLKQVFLIGTGHVKARVDSSTKKSDVSRRFRVPRGATRLYLAVMDAYEWNNNEGYFDVTVTAERTDTSSNAYNVDSSAYSVDSNATFAKWSCLPDRRQCTPDRAVVEVKGTRQYHVILPAQLEWGVSIPTPDGATVVVERVSGMVCLDSPSTGTNPCNGPKGSGERAGPEFLTPGKTVGELVSKTVDDKTYFSVNGRSGSTFQVYQGYFEFDVTMR